MFSRYKNTTDIERSILYLLCSFALVHLSLIFFCFDFPIVRKIIISAISLLVWCAGILYILFRVQKFKKDISRLLKQFSVITGIICLFLISAYVSPYTHNLWGERLCALLSVSVSLFIIFISGYILNIYDGNENPCYKKLLQIQADKTLLIIILVTIITRVGMLDTLQRWDAGEYYYALGNACSNFNLTWSSFFDGFRLCNHTTLGYSFIMSIGEFLNPRGIVGVMTVSLILTVLAFSNLYKILIRIFEDTSKNIIGIIVLVASVCPFVLGGFGYLTPDYITLVTFVLALCAEYKKEYLLQFFWLSICLNTKESAIFAVFGYFLFKLIVILVCQVKSKELSFKDLIKMPSLWAGVLSALAFLAILSIQGGFLWKGGTNEKAIQFSSTNVNSFGFNPDYILFRLKQHFVLNFSWIFTLMIIVTLAFALLKKRRLTAVNKKIFIISVTGYLFFALLANCIFITAGAYRYTTIYIFFYTLIALLLFWEIIGRYISKKICCITFSVVFALNFIEAFIHIDPLSYVLFETRSTGGWYTVLTNYTHDKYGNDLCNNRQYAYLDKALDKMLENIDFDGTQDIIILGNQGQGSQINGNGTHYCVCWNTRSQKRVIYDEAMLMQDDTLKLITCTTEYDILYKFYENTLSPVAYAVFIPYYELDEEDCLTFVSQFYQVGEKQEVSVMGTTLVYYPLSR